MSYGQAGRLHWPDGATATLARGHWTSTHPIWTALVLAAVPTEVSIIEPDADYWRALDAARAVGATMMDAAPMRRDPPTDVVGDQPAVTPSADIRDLYSPDQPRVPAGSGDESGQWVGGLSGLVATISQPDGGFTYSPATGESPTSGFALSIYKGREVVLDRADVTLAALARFVRQNRDLLRQRGNYLGAWHNPENHRVYLDVSKVVSDEAVAARLARQHQQLAYFDLAHGRSIPTPPEAVH